MAKNDARDRARLREALEKSTSTRHAIVREPALVSPRIAGTQQNYLARASVKPRGRKMNSANNARAKQQNTLVRSTKATDEQSGVGIRTTEAFGVKPVGLL